MFNQATVNEILGLIRECGIADPEDGDHSFLEDKVREMKENEAKVIIQNGFLSQLQYVCGQFSTPEGIASVRKEIEGMILVNAEGGWVECSCMITPTKRCRAQEFKSKAKAVGQGFYCRECAEREKRR